MTAPGQQSEVWLSTKFAPAEVGVYQRRYSGMLMGNYQWNGVDWKYPTGDKTSLQDGEWLCEPGVWALSGGQRPELPRKTWIAAIRQSIGECDWGGLGSDIDLLMWTPILAFRLAPSAMGNAVEAGSGMEGHARSMVEVTRHEAEGNALNRASRTLSIWQPSETSPAGVESGLPVSAAPLADRAKCWDCLAEYSMGRSACPGCGAANANHSDASFELARKQLREKEQRGSAAATASEGQPVSGREFSDAVTGLGAGEAGTPAPSQSDSHPIRDRYGLKGPAEVRKSTEYSIAANFWREWR